MAGLHEAEDLAEVPRVKGRAAYGVKRAAVDAAKALKISREGPVQHGGWADTQVPDRIYADQQAEYAPEEAARDLRARIRGEGAPNGRAAYPKRTPDTRTAYLEGTPFGRSCYGASSWRSGPG